MADYSEQQLIGALRKADAAGDTEAARAIARRIQSMRQGKPAAKPASRSLAQEAGHQLSYGTRALLGGVAAVPDFIMEPFAQMGEAAGLPRQTRFRDMAEGLSDAIGLDRPESDADHLSARATEAISSVMTGAGPARYIAAEGRPILQGIKDTLTSRPGLQAASAVGGAEAAEITRQGGGGQGAQLAAGVAGSLVPGVKPMAAEGVRRALRGGEKGRQRVLANQEMFRRAGVSSPTVGQVTEGRFARAVESGLAGFPGSAGVMSRTAQRQADEVGARAAQIADGLAPGADPVTAGMAIEQGILGPGGYNERLRGAVGSAYGALDRYIPAHSPVQIDNSLSTLRALANPIPGARATSAQMRDGKLTNILDALVADSTHTNTFPGVPSANTVPFSALKAQRTEVGHMVGDAKYGKIGTPERQLSRTYGAMSEDMRGAARSAGPQAERALDRANRINAAGAERTGTLAKIVNQSTPEKIYAAAMSGTAGGATQLEALMKSLPRDAQQIVAATVIKRMGRAANHMQDVDGGQFSAERFKNAWADMSPQARAAIFGRLSPQVQREVEAIAGVGRNVQDGSRVFANPSGSGGKLLQLIGGSGIGTAIVTGEPMTAAAILGTAGAANGLARMMTNQKMVDALGRQTGMPAYLLPGAAYGSAQHPPKRPDRKGK